MTLTSIILILAVALVNLTLGFGAAALVGRGPWSAHARNLQSMSLDAPAHSDLDAPNVEHNTSLDRAEARDLRAIESADVPAMPAEALSDQALQTLQQVAAGIEMLEQGLQSLHQQIKNGGDGEQKQSPRWAATIISQAKQLSEIREVFCSLAEHHYLPADIKGPTIDSLAALQALFQATASTIGQRTVACSDRCAAVDGLLNACQGARGSINAAWFFQTQS